jgi:hypothetical protein
MLAEGEGSMRRLGLSLCREDRIGWLVHRLIFCGFVFVWTRAPICRSAPAVFERVCSTLHGRIYEQR